MRGYDFYYWLFMISSGIMMTIISFFYREVSFNIFFNICLGLFIGGILMAVASIILAEMSVDSQDNDQIGHIDHVDHLDHVDHTDQIEHDDHNIDSNDLSDTTPAPFMLIFSTFLLVFGISGIILYSFITNWLRFLIFFITPFIAYFITYYISVGWKKIAKSRYYSISSTQNLIGLQGEVILMVDHRGGVIKIPSHTPLKFERIHVKPLKLDSQFEKGETVYICDVRNGFLLVDIDKKLIKRR